MGLEGNTAFLFGTSKIDEQVCVGFCISITLSPTEVHILGKTQLFHLISYSFSGIITSRRDSVREVVQALVSDRRVCLDPGSATC